MQLTSEHPSRKQGSHFRSNEKEDLPSGRSSQKFAHRTYHVHSLSIVGQRSRNGMKPRPGVSMQVPQRVEQAVLRRQQEFDASRVQ